MLHCYYFHFTRHYCHFGTVTDLLLLEHQSAVCSETLEDRIKGVNRQHWNWSLPFSSCGRRQASHCFTENRCGGPIPCISMCSSSASTRQEKGQSRWCLQVGTCTTVTDIQSHLKLADLACITKRFNLFGGGHGNNWWLLSTWSFVLRIGSFIQVHYFAQPSSFFSYTSLRVNWIIWK